MTQHAKAIFRVMDSLRGKMSPSDVASLLRHCKDAGIPVGIEELLFVVTHIGRCLDHFVPSGIADFVARLVELHSPKNLLDPWAGMGLLTIPVNDRLNPESFEAYCLDQSHAEVWRLLNEESGVTLHHGDALTALPESARTFDAVVGCPPWGRKAQGPLRVRIGNDEIFVEDDYGHLLILESCLHLSEKGLGVFIVRDAFFWDSGKVRHTLEQLGIRVTYAIQLPAGSFTPLTNIPTHIIVLQRTSDKTLFTAKYSPDLKHQKELLKNLRSRTEGASASLGRVVAGESFRGFSPIEFTEQLTEQARRMGLVPYAFNDVIQELTTRSKTKGSGDLPEKPNSVYLPQMAATPATTSQEALPDRLKSYYQLVVNPEIADAAFLAGLLNTSFGQLWRDSLRTGSTIPRIGKEVLETSILYLPPKKSREVQREVIDCNQDIARLISELRELEALLWKRPADIGKVQSSVQKVNREDRFQDWIDTLPFPLASILWACHTQTGSYREKYERKVHFFEALAEFLAVVHLSAFTRHAIWSELKEKLTETLGRNSLSLKMATFGTWKTIVEVLSAETRRVLNDEPELCFELFRTRNRELLETIASKRLVGVIQATNAIRNDWLGHTGAVREADARAVNEQLAQHIGIVRETFGVVWEGYTLLLPGSCRMKAGLFEYTVRRVMGSRTPFPSENVELAEPMEDGHLHLWSQNETRALKLLPLVKVMPSPRTEENACYFYNRKQKDGIRFLSYHFDADSEVVEQFSDVADALRIVVGDEKNG